MKKVWVLVVAVFVISFAAISCCSEQTISKGRIERRVFEQLDSVVNANKGDSIFYSSPYLIKKLEAITKIKATDKGGSYVGKLYFTKENYEKWHEWYEKKYGKKG
jgi:hypothetical protein